MSPAIEVTLLWVAFAATHIGLSSDLVRPKLARLLGKLGFLVAYSIVALAIFVPLVRIYFEGRQLGPWVLPVERGTVLLWVNYGIMGTAFVFLVAAFVRRSPAAVVPGDVTPRGIYRITRHPLMMAIALFGLGHLLQNGRTTDLAFFGGLAGFALLGSWHQDRRKLESGDPAFQHFYDETPFFPFTGRSTMRGLRELPGWIVLVGIAVTVGIRWFHASWFGAALPG